MATLSWPAAIVPASITWHLQPNTASFESPLSRAAQTTELAGARWVADVTLPPFKIDADRRALTVFIARLRGQSGRVYVGPWHATGISAETYAAGSGATADATTPTADATTPTADEAFPSTLGTPVVNGASQAGASLSVRGWTAGIVVARAGDYFSYDTALGRTLHMVMEDAQSNGAGIASLVVEPPIRTSPADGAALEIVAPTCIMRLKDDDTGAPGFQPGIFAQSSLSLVEAF